MPHTIHRERGGRSYACEHVCVYRGDNNQLICFTLTSNKKNIVLVIFLSDEKNEMGKKDVDHTACMIAGAKPF